MLSFDWELSFNLDESPNVNCPMSDVNVTKLSLRDSQLIIFVLHDSQHDESSLSRDLSNLDTKSMCQHVQKKHGIYYLAVYTESDTPKISLFVPSHGMPLYYISLEGITYLSSIPSNLVPHQPKFSLNSHYVVDAILSYQSRRPPFDSILRNVHRIPPGTLVEFNIVNKMIVSHQVCASVEWARGNPTNEKDIIPSLIQTLESMTRKDKEPNLYLSGGMDSSILAVVLSNLSIPFQALHFAVDERSRANVDLLQKRFGFDLRIAEYDKKTVDFTNAENKGKTGVLLACRPYVPMSIRVDSSNGKSQNNVVNLHGQNADAIISIHDHNIPRNLKSPKDTAYKAWSRIMLTSNMTRLFGLFGKLARDRYLKGLFLPGHDSGVPFFIRPHQLVTIPEIIEWKNHQFLETLSMPSKIDTFMVKAIRWLEYGANAQEESLTRGNGLVFTSYNTFITLMNLPVGVDMIFDAKAPLSKQFEEVAGIKWEEIAVTGALKFSQSKGLKNDPNGDEKVREKLSKINWERTFDNLEPWAKQILLNWKNFVEQQDSYVTRLDVLDSIGNLVALDCFLETYS